LTERTISSLEAQKIPYVKGIVSALQPWPLSNERAWAIVQEQLRPLHEDTHRILKQADDVIQAQQQRIEQAQRFIEDLKLSLDPYDIEEDHMNRVLEILRGVK
jgi:hypothetical protein